MQPIWLKKEEAQKRFDICKTCEKIMLPVYMCSECLCFMKVKTKLTISECPLKKW